MRSVCFLIVFSVSTFSYSQGTWVQKTSLPGQARWSAVAFTINDKGYIGTGKSSSMLLNDFWEYNPTTNSWTQKANFGGGKRKLAAGFSVENFGYIGTGNDSINFYNDLWKYDPSANNWVQVSSIPGAAREKAVGFSIGNKGYIGTGEYFNGSNWVVQNDFFEYDPATDSWNPIANFINGRADIDRAVFVIGNNAYLGTGTAWAYYTDFWQYNSLSNSWTQKANVPGPGRIGATGFSLCNLGYLGLGYDFSSVLDDFIHMIRF